MSAEDAAKLIISVGLVTPTDELLNPPTPFTARLKQKLKK